jgi:hypothetical protein
VSSSGLIYAVIVGAWAAYLVPMWLRRQDELNESRPTERFSTAIRLLSGRAAMERKVTKGLSAEDAEDPGDPGDSGPEAGGGESSDVVESAAGCSSADSGSGAARRRADLLARRRRMVTLLFLAFTLGMIVAGVWGPAFLWAPMIPAVLFSLYIVRLRRQERRRWAVRLDPHRRPADPVHQPRAPHRSAGGDRRRHPADHPARSRTGHAARRPSANRPSQNRPGSDRGSTDYARADYAEDDPDHADYAPPDNSRASAHPVSAPTPERTPAAAADEAAGHEHSGARAPAPDPDEFADPDDCGDPADAGDGWEPVPVPLPTYVTAPVAPRSTDALDLGAPDAWSAARAEPPAAQPHPERTDQPDRRRSSARPPRTPLFDQYADDHRPAANE